MGRWASAIVLRLLFAILCTVAIVWLALWYFIPTPPSSITIDAGIKNGAFSAVAERYRVRLARQHVKLNIRVSDNPQPGNLALVEDPKSGVDAAFIFSGASDAKHSADLVSLGRISYAPIWIVYRGTETLDRLTQLKGKVVTYSPAIPDLIKRVLAAHGVTPGNTTMSQMLGPSAIKGLKDGNIDVTVLAPQEIHSRVVQPLWHNPQLRFMNLTQAETLARLFPSLTHLVLPQGAVDLEKNIPASDMHLIATANAVVARKDLHPELIFLLAQTMQEEHGGAGIFQRFGEFPNTDNLEFPVAEVARDFYKNGPSFLQRYLPYWMINYAKRVAAILVTTMAIIIPIFSFAPRLYMWFLQVYTEKLYRRLRLIEASLQPDLTFPEIEDLKSDLESIGRAAHILPMRHSSLFFDLIMHIRLTRTELASRLATLRDRAA